MKERLVALCALAVASAACSANDVTDTSTTTLPTVLVTNASCTNGGCRTLEVRAFVYAFEIPQPPTGSEAVGEVPPGQTCFVFPALWTSTVIGPDLTGRVDTLITKWTPADAAGIYLVAVDSAIFHGGPKNQAQIDSLNNAVFPYQGLGAAVGETPQFVPGGAVGWNVTFPSAPIERAPLTPGTACKP